jgi:hypothetical protein
MYNSRPEMRAVVKVGSTRYCSGTLHCNESWTSLPGPVTFKFWRCRPFGQRSIDSLGHVRIDRIRYRSPVWLPAKPSQKMRPESLAITWFGITAASRAYDSFNGILNNLASSHRSGVPDSHHVQTFSGKRSGDLRGTANRCTSWRGTHSQRPALSFSGIGQGVPSLRLQRGDLRRPSGPGTGPGPDSV